MTEAVNSDEGKGRDGNAIIAIAAKFNVSMFATTVSFVRNATSSNVAGVNDRGAFGSATARSRSRALLGVPGAVTTLYQTKAIAMGNSRTAMDTPSRSPSAAIASENIRRFPHERRSHVAAQLHAGHKLHGRNVASRTMTGRTAAYPRKPSSGG